jgi:hypothetical protein
MTANMMIFNCEIGEVQIFKKSTLVASNLAKSGSQDPTPIEDLSK